ncbi:class I SAM-dependent methyltransferase [Nocardia donostiensis]|uniref:class I SAM-dependent methyltransferase n=1 Tax=Nocardia donostiensis TaxID=1538463 RepID=UPI00111593F6|nr:class I SAM-dependent methyltransferase [Nocardia donostiensis]
MRSDYAAAAEFYELVADRQVRVSGPVLVTALAGVDTSAGPVVEIGAGTGRVTEIIAEVLPGARVLAAEPCDPMRAVLTARVLRGDLRDRVTVVAESAQTLPLPDRISAAVVFGVVNHLTPDERVDLLRRLARRLPQGAPIVVELMGGTRAQPVRRTRILREPIGGLVYEWWGSAEPVTDRRLHWRTTWKVLRGDELVRLVREDYDWELVGLDELAEETGLRSRLLGPEIGVLTT